MIRATTLALALSLSAPALAQTQAAMNATAARAAQVADQRLNARYAATMRSLSPPSRLLLRDAQRAWIGFRDRQCDYEASAVTGGSAFPMVRSGCLKRLIEDRTRQLAAYGSCKEGDLACPR